MDVKKLFSGIAVIIDDEVDKKEAPIYKIRTNIVNSNIPVVAYRSIPSVDTLESLKNASFIILDWNFFDGSIGEMDEGLRGLVGASELKNQQQEELIKFIKLLLDKLFVPVFIFSGVDIGEVEDDLSERGLYYKGKANRIFVKSKSEVESEEQLFQSIEEWLTKMPSIYAMKEWDSVFQTTKNNMFREWYQYAPQWVSVIWDMLKADSSEVQNEFGEFLTRNIVNRIQAFRFEETLFALDAKPNQNELKRVIERERYIEYSDNMPEQAYTGDLFKVDNTYYLNIRAQCDLARKDDSIFLYLIKGRELDARDIVTEDIHFVSEGELKFPNRAYELKQIQKICDNAKDRKEDTVKELQEINEQFREYRNQIFFSHGEILEKKPEVILACIDNGKILKFRMDLVMRKFKEIKDKRIGRVLPPYITRIQQKCSQYIVREGTMPIPPEIFDSFEE